MSRPVAIYPEYEIQKVVNHLTTERAINSIDENSGISTIYVDSTMILNDRNPIYLTAGLYVRIGNVNYIVSNVVKNRSFNIEATKLSAASPWSLALEFRPGSRMEVEKLLVVDSKKPQKQWSEFPLLWMINDGTNDRDSSFPPPIDFKYSLKIAMINLTEIQLTTGERLEDKLEPTTKPYIDLLLATFRSVYFRTVFHFEDSEIKEGKEFFRFFYGSESKNKTMFTAVTDAIEFEMQLGFKQQYNCTIDPLTGITYAFDSEDNVIQSRASYVPENPATEPAFNLNDDGDLIVTYPDNYIGVNFYIDDNDNLAY